MRGLNITPDCIDMTTTSQDIKEKVTNVDRWVDIVDWIHHSLPIVSWRRACTSLRLHNNCSSKDAKHLCQLSTQESQSVL